jgi:hypothetical protein
LQMVFQTLFSFLSFAKGFEIIFGAAVR